jgi:hypothetical protein
VAPATQPTTLITNSLCHPPSSPQMGAVRGAAERLFGPSPTEVASGVQDSRVKELTEEAGGYGVLGGTPKVDAVKEYLQDSEIVERGGLAAMEPAGAPGGWWVVVGGCVRQRVVVGAVGGRRGGGCMSEP